MSNLTSQQERAVTTRAVSVVLASGAGCGKTHVLTARYLGHLTHGEAEVSQLVAITFTERAARQMRGRIRQTLTARLRAASADEEETWARHLRALESAPICTIHAFCGNLLRTHAIEAGLDPRFDVLEEVLAANVQAEALQIGLQKLLTTTEPAGDDLRALVDHYGWSAVVAGAQGLLRDYDARTWDPWLQRPASEIADEWRTTARAFVQHRYLPFLVRTRPKIVRAMNLLARHPTKHAEMAARVTTLCHRLPLLGDEPDLASAIEELCQAGSVGAIGKKAWPSLVVYERIRDALAGLREELRTLPEKVPPLDEPNLEAAVAMGQRLGRVVGAVQREYAARKHLAGVVDFQDLLLLSRNLLRDSPEVRQRQQDRYRFLLIDELQDTDPVQLELVEALCGDGLSVGKLFAVGDASQSIYRFRGADVQLFRGLRETVPQEGRQELTLNFRSQPAILQFTNLLVGPRLEGYENLVAHRPQSNTGPCIEFLWSEQPPRGSADPDDLGAVAAGRRNEAEYIARRIVAMIQSERLVEEGATLRRVRPGDVVLLFRAMTHVATYEAALRKYGLDYYLVGGRAFFAQQEVYDLLHLLRTLDNPQDSTSLAGTLRSPFCCLSDEALFVLARYSEGLWAGVNAASLEGELPPGQVAGVRRARRFLQAWRADKDRVPLAALLQRAISDSAYDAALQLEHLGERKLANLWKLLDLARTFDRSGLFGLAEFIARLGDFVETGSREEQAATQPENADVVRLMSIHQAKGLEFPVVFLPDLSRVDRPRTAGLGQWTPDLGLVVRPGDEEDRELPALGWRLRAATVEMEEWAEELRVLYVGCTRAMDYLVLSGARPEGALPNAPWLLTLAEAFDLESGACRTQAVAAPAVRVFTPSNPPPEVSPLAPVPARPVEAVAVVRQSVAPRLAPLRGLGSVSIEELDRALTEGVLLGAAPLTSGDVAAQYDAEDGSDRHAWARPGDSLARHVADPVTALLRAVLAQWDYADADGWRPWLDGAIRIENRALRPGLEQLLADLARSSLRVELAQARELRREVSYTLDLSAEREPLPVVAGLLDTLWQDKAGWHLLFWNIPPRSERAAWAIHQNAATLASEALAQAGIQLKSVRIYRCPEGAVDRHRPPTAKARAVLVSSVRSTLRTWRDRSLNTTSF